MMFRPRVFFGFFLRRPELWMAVLLAVTVSAAAQRSGAAGSVRYHFGNDARWSAPDFDDRGWTVAEEGLVPSVAGRDDSFVWIRMRIPVASGLPEPLALHLSGLGLQPTAWQVFVNGHAVGGQGAFPPRADPASPPLCPVIALPSDLARSGSTVVVAIREWQALSFFGTHVPSRPVATIDEMRVLELSLRAGAAETLATNAPEDALSALLALLGLLLLFVWRRSGAREYLWAAVFLLTPLLTAVLSSSAATARLSFHEQALAWSFAYAAGLIAEIELMWVLFGLRSRPLHIVWHAIWVAFIAAQIGETYFLDRPGFEHFFRIVIVLLIPAFDAILLPLCIRELFRRRGNRAFAAAMCVMEVIIGLGAFGYSVHVTLGPFTLDLFQLGVTLVDLAIAGLLIGRAARAWREANALRVEFEAAREVQKRLVAVPLLVPGFHIESVYRPAAEVGGDFYALRPLEGGGVQIVVGDVSGKGLPAAMTVSAVVGALRAMSMLTPEQVLVDLNRSLAGTIGHGFVTCCVTQIFADGQMTIANAGHLAPYRNGVELECGNGLPLGITSEAAFEERPFSLAAGDTLTFLSDGVVEARSASGELFGFERAATVATQSAEEIAEAAQRFGQEDDITVLTLAFAGAEVAHAQA